MMAHVKRRIRCGGKPMTVLVLAGGRSRRMKADKAGLDVGGRTLLEHVLAQVEPLFDEVLIGLSPGQRVDLRERKGSMTRSSERRDRTRARVIEGVESGSAPDLRIVRDVTSGLGPMAGILAGLTAARNDACMVIACDIPDIDAPFLRRLARAAAKAEIAVPVTAAGQFEPLFAVYTKGVIPEIEGLLVSGERSLLPLFPRCRTVRVPLGDAPWLRNLNTRAEYEDFLRGRTKSSR